MKLEAGNMRKEDFSISLMNGILLVMKVKMIKV